MGAVCYPKFLLRSRRQSSFSDSHLPPILTDQLVRSGFFFLKSALSVICVCCGQKWQNAENPAARLEGHLAQVPSCASIRNTTTVSIASPQIEFSSPSTPPP